MGCRSKQTRQEVGGMNWALHEGMGAKKKGAGTAERNCESAGESNVSGTRHC